MVEETTTTTEETVQDEAPDSHDAFVSILVDMGLTAEQAEAVHSMAMDLINAGDGETSETTETTETVTEEQKVEARRQRRMGGKKRGYSRRRGMSEERGPVRGRRGASRREMSSTERMERQMRRLARENREMREELNRMGAKPAARPLSNRPSRRNESDGTGAQTLTASTQAALNMINQYKK